MIKKKSIGKILGMKRTPTMAFNNKVRLQKHNLLIHTNK